MSSSMGPQVGSSSISGGSSSDYVSSGYMGSQVHSVCHGGTHVVMGQVVNSAGDVPRA